MEIYPVVVYVHAASILLFFILHGVSMVVAFRLKQERDPARLAALLDLSASAMSAPAIVTASVGVLAGIAAGIMGGWWTTAWFWVSLVLFVVVALAMTPMAAMRLRNLRIAVGASTTAARRGDTDITEPPDPAAVARLVDEWNPIPVAAIGLPAFLVILWLMLFKPF